MWERIDGVQQGEVGVVLRGFDVGFEGVELAPRKVLVLSSREVIIWFSEQGCHLGQAW